MPTSLLLQGVQAGVVDQQVAGVLVVIVNLRASL
jgi:hypothetical protein